MTVTSSPTLHELALALHDLSWRVARFGPAQVGIDPLPATELAVLRAVMMTPGGSVSDVAAALSMQSSNVSAAVRVLVNRGLVDKQPSPTDGRVTLLRPTAKALDERDVIEKAIAGTLVAALGEISEDGVRALVDAVPAMRELAVAVTTQVGQRMSS
ncbi:MarR family winged helix-turn-helix transcriptional regulator [Mycobacterium sp. MYCO198283]|uniref:MarR family winged helix-turn-helix transcriptional regulator n=1 Tax=Mycobacterium sp. MYCO198283 TaxID=2883505 RepID=UPI001E64599D|nr:MarR family winged helix-turn-helix transcriptional regulator [Mycobacterium sp. MYCO198283]MCG5433745.1 MarR family winged helix-turn-helix transcriptional regulator [Mycobacterium sp. MYCO198283]